MRIHTVGAILGGGAGQRIGGRKPFVTLGGIALVEHVARALRPTAEALAVVGDAEAARLIGAVELVDPPALERGPLAGVCAALDWGQSKSAKWVVIAPCDSPLLPANLTERLGDAAGDAGAAFVETTDGPHPLVSLWRSDLAEWLRGQLAQGHPSVRSVLGKAGGVPVRFDEAEAFINVNTPEDLLKAERLIARRG